MSFFRKGGLFNLGRNLFKKQASGVNKIFSKASEGLNFLNSDRVKSVVNSPVLDNIANKVGGTQLLGNVRNVMGSLENAKKFTDAGAEVGNIYSDIADKGVNKNTIERVSKLAKTFS
jgi:hypothetical protein